MQETPNNIALQYYTSSSTSTDPKGSWSTSESEHPLSQSPSIGSLEVDHTEEDFNRDEMTRATGFIGKGSEITWVQQLNREIDHDHGSCPTTPRPENHANPRVAQSNYYLDDLELRCVAHLDAHEVPTHEVASRLLNAYLASVHPSFPIIGIATFMSQFQVFYNQQSLRPGNKWLAILNLMLAIGTRYTQLADPCLQHDGNEHMKYFSRAKSLSLDDQLFQPFDLQQLQVEGLASFYLLMLGHLNRYVSVFFFFFFLVKKGSPSTLGPSIYYLLIGPYADLGS